VEWTSSDHLHHEAEKIEVKEVEVLYLRSHDQHLPHVVEVNPRLYD
jgi:hypothetical protein